jgi:hypothetical protein
MCGVLALAIVAEFLVTMGLIYYASPRYAWEWWKDDGTARRELREGLYARRRPLAISVVLTVACTVLSLAAC